MRFFFYTVVPLIFAFTGAWAMSASTGTLTASEHAAFMQQVRQQIESRMSTDHSSKTVACRGEAICGLKLIPLFYRERDFSPVWMRDRMLEPKAQTLIRTVKTAYRDGLQPQDYHAIAIAETLAALNNSNGLTPRMQAEYWADLDLLLTDAFLLLGTHLSSGRIDPETLHSDWLVPERSIDLLPLLQTASNTHRLGKAIERLRPAHRGYIALRKALQRLRNVQVQGGWPTIAAGPSLRPGAIEPRVPAVHRRLELAGDMEPDRIPEAPHRYDDHLTNAVRYFQARHGLKPDGVVGPKTRRAMNVPVETRIRQIELNLERWRWLPHDLGDRYIAVNTADFSLSVVENDLDVLKMRVVVGRPARRTPVFSSQMAYLVFNPYWSVPRIIAVEDILPKLTSDAQYLTRQHIRVFRNLSGVTREVDPRTVDWKRYNAHDFPFRLRQEPGPGNALGRIKFVFPNRFAVYLHDTPQRSLFKLSQRDFSSGCIRLENAGALAGYLLADRPGWTSNSIAARLKTGTRRVVRIPDPIPVHLIYMTAWVDPNNRLQFRQDIYGRDRALNAALMQRPPDPLPPLATIK